MNSPGPGRRMPAPAGLIAILLYLLVVGALLVCIVGEGALVVLMARHAF